MRKILLAGAAMLATTGMAMAADSEGVAISAIVTASCSLTDPSDISFPSNAAPGAFVDRSFDFSCNFAGDNGNTLKVAFSSVNGGLKNTLDSTTRVYNVEYGANAAVASSAITFPTTQEYAETSAAANTPETRNFKVTLVGTLAVAGTYADTLNVSIAP